jgi:hypothetical protein
MPCYKLSIKFAVSHSVKFYYKDYGNNKSLSMMNNFLIVWTQLGTLQVNLKKISTSHG